MHSRSTVATLVLVISGQFAPAGTLRDAVPAQIRHVDYRAIVTGSAARASVTGQVETLRDGWSTVPLFPQSLPVTEARCSDPDAEFARWKGQFAIFLRKRGTATFEIEFRRPVQSKDGWQRTSLPIAEAMTKHISLTIPAARIAVKTLPSTLFEQRTVNGSTVVDLYPRRKGWLELRWRPVSDEEVRGSFLAEGWTLATVGMGLAARVDRIRLTPRQGETESVALVLQPPGPDHRWAVKSVQGALVADWVVAHDQNTDRVRVRLASPLRAPSELEILSEQTAPPDRPLPLRPVGVEGAERQRGIFYAMPREGVELEVAQREHCSKVDGSTVKQHFRDEGVGVSIAYGYPSLKALLALRPRLRRARASATVDTLATIAGGVVTTESHVRYDIAKPGVFAFELEADADMRVLEVAGKGVSDYTADGQAVTVRLKERALGKYELRVLAQRKLEREGDVVIPRVRSVGTDREWGAIAVAAGEEGELRHVRAALCDQVDPNRLPDWMREAAPALAYEYRTGGAQVTVRSEPVVAKLDVKTVDEVRISDRIIHRATHFRCEVEHGAAFGFEVTVPSGFVPISVGSSSGLSASYGRRAPRLVKPPGTTASRPAIEDWSFDARTQMLTINLAEGARDQYGFVVRSEGMREDPAAVSLAGFELKGASQVTGLLVISQDCYVALTPTTETDLDGADPRKLRFRTPPEHRPELVFRFLTGRWALTLALAEKAPAIDAMSATLILAQRGWISVVTDLWLQVEHAPIGRVRIELPPGASRPEFDSIGLRRRDFDGKGWTLTYHSRFVGRQLVNLTYSLSAPDDGAVKYVTPRVEGAARHRAGLFVVQGREMDTVEIVEDENFSPTLHDELFQEYEERISRPVLYQFSSTRAESSLAIRIVSHELAGAGETVAENCRIHTRLLRDGQAVSRLDCTIHNVAQQFLGIRFPNAESRVWGTYFNGRPIRPTREADKTLVPLRDARYLGESARVAVVWLDPIPPLGGRAPLDLATPKLDIKVGKVDWRVELPAEFELHVKEKNMVAGREPPTPGIFASVHAIFQPEIRQLDRWHRRVVRPVWWRVESTIRVALRIAAIALVTVTLIAMAAGLGYVLRRHMKSKVTRTRWHWATRAAIAVLILVVLAGMFLPVLSRSREEARKMKARSNLRQLGIAMVQYLDNKGDQRYYPNSPESLLSARVIAEQGVFYCPSCGEPFESALGYGMTDNVPGDQPSVYHYCGPGDPLHVLFFDGHVEYIADQKKVLDFAKRHRLPPPPSRDTDAVHREYAKARAAQGDWKHELAKRRYRAVISRYPSSPWAKRARLRLEQIRHQEYSDKHGTDKGYDFSSFMAAANDPGDVMAWPSPGDTVMGSDDTEGRPNDGSGLTSAFFDGHVEFLNDLDVGGVDVESPLDFIADGAEVPPRAGSVRVGLGTDDKEAQPAKEEGFSVLHLDAGKKTEARADGKDRRTEGGKQIAELAQQLAYSQRGNIRSQKEVAKLDRLLERETKAPHEKKTKEAEESAPRAWGDTVRGETRDEDELTGAVALAPAEPATPTRRVEAVPAPPRKRPPRAPEKPAGTIEPAQPEEPPAPDQFGRLEELTALPPQGTMGRLSRHGQAVAPWAGCRAMGRPWALCPSESPCLETRP